ncbi:hypothetical protein PG997_010075 [Apiospora hydei]|uniref:Uncharacterized protein n=1 Tax=Apiospora hydei TaxID=1337664 RepID=A0ABR1VX40_9PEZI
MNLCSSSSIDSPRHAALAPSQPRPAGLHSQRRRRLGLGPLETCTGRAAEEQRDERGTAATDLIRRRVPYQFEAREVPDIPGDVATEAETLDDHDHDRGEQPESTSSGGKQPYPQSPHSTATVKVYATVSETHEKCSTCGSSSTQGEPSTTAATVTPSDTEQSSAQPGTTTTAATVPTSAETSTTSPEASEEPSSTMAASSSSTPPPGTRSTVHITVTKHRTTTITVQRTPTASTSTTTVQAEEPSNFPQPGPDVERGARGS